MTIAPDEVERAKVVAYLRATADIFAERMDGGVQPSVSRHHYNACTYAAAASERGEHLESHKQEKGE